MNERRYLIEVLLRAREQVSQVARKAVQALDQVTAAQTRNAQSSAKNATAINQQIGALRQLVEAHTREKKALDESAEALRKTANARAQAAAASRAELEALRKRAQLERAEANQREKADIEEITRMRARAAELDAFTEKKTAAVRAEISQLRKEATAFEALAKEEAATNRRRASELDLRIAQTQQTTRETIRSAAEAEKAARAEERARDRVGKALGQNVKELERLGARVDTSDRHVGRFTSTLSRLGITSGGAARGLRGLNAEFQGFQLALVIKYAQALLSVLVALAGQLIAVGAAAVQAGAGLVGAFAAGAAQAIPVIGVLGAAIARLTSVLKAVKQQNDQQLTATHDAAAAAKRQADATDSLRSAQERVEDAHRNVAQAQEDLNNARKEAIRTVEDLIAAEQDAIQTLENARASQRRAIRTGDVAGAVQAQLGIESAQRGLTRAREDAAGARSRGVGGVDAVIAAERRLVDARRAEQRANEDLNKTRRQTSENLAQETAAVDKLADMLKQLSPAERELYQRILRLQETYKRVARPITDIITRAFTDVVDRVNSLLQDPRIIRGFRNIAVQIARSIRTATREVGGGQSIGAFEILSDEAARNIPQVTRILINFFGAIRNLVIDAIPAFRLLLDYIEGYSKQARDATRNSKGIRDFFIDGIKYANSFFKLALAIVRLFLALSGSGGAASEGIKTVDQLTDLVDGLTEKVRKHGGEVRRFFGQSRDVLFEIIGLIGDVAKEILASFSAKSVSTFADFLKRVIIPALGDVIRIMGVMAQLFHQVFSLPGVADVARFAATILFLAKGLTIIRVAILDVLEVVPNFLRAMGLMAAAEEGVGAAGTAGFAALTPAGWIFLAIVGIIALIVLLDRKFHFLGPTFKWLKGAAGDTFGFLKKVGQSVVDWFSDVWTQGLLKWLRYPFEWAAKHLVAPAFKWLRDAVGDIIAFFRDKFASGQGFWGHLGNVILAPFRFARGYIETILDGVKTVVEVFLDILAGRWSDAGEALEGFFTRLLDRVGGLATTLIGILQTLLEVAGKIPGVGAPFKAAAREVEKLKDKIDGWREGLRKSKDDQDSNTDSVKKALPNLVQLRERYQDAKDRLDLLRPGTKAYKDAVKDAQEAGKKYNDSLKETAKNADGARPSVRTLRRNIDQLGSVSSETADVVARQLNEVLKSVGAKTIRINTKIYKHSGINEMTDVLGHAATGGRLHRGGVSRRLWGGGVPNPYGGSGDDHLLYSPSGFPVAALSGTEGIINRPQMGIIDDSLAATAAMGMQPYGGLNDLWGSGLRHYQTGGGLHDAVRQLANRLVRSFGLQITSTTGGQHARHSYHGQGLAADLGGPFERMRAAARYLSSSGVARHLLEGIHNPGLSVKDGRKVPASFWGAGTWADHVDHIHIALNSLVSTLRGLPSVGADLIRGARITGPAGPLLDAARGVNRRMTRASNRYLSRTLGILGGGDVRAMGADANVVSAFRRAINTLRANRVEQLALWEAGIVESGLRNLPYGDRDSLGALQERASIFGRSHALNPFASALRFLRDAISRRPWRGSAGSLAQAVQRSAFPGRYDQVRGRALRYLQTGGPIASTARARTRLPRTLPGASRVDIKAINDLLKDIADVFKGLTTSALRKTKGLALRIQRAFTELTEDGGTLDQLHQAVENIATRGALRLQRRQFIVGREGPRRADVSASDIAQAQLQNLQAVGTGLTAEQTELEGGLAAAQRSLRQATRAKNKKAQAAARAAIANLKQRLEQNATDIAQNAQDQVEAQENYQQSLVDAITQNADRTSGAIDRQQRLLKAFGRTMDPNVVLGQQIANMQQQIGGLQGVLNQAVRSGNTTLANQLRDQIDELNTQIAEAAAQQFQNAIDAVNNQAQLQGARLDRATRRAQIGQTDFGALGTILGQRGDVLRGQRGGLAALLNQAIASGNVDQITNLTDQIDELDTQLAENTQAIRDNTDAAFNFRTQQINDAFGFSQSVFGGAQSFFQALTSRTGISTIAQQAAALQGIGTALGTQQGGLKAQLASLLGYSPTEANALANLSGAGLVDFLTSITTGPAFEAIMARLDPTQQSSFKDLVTGLIQNATATEQNTQALQELTGNNAQSFTSSMWQAFRTAIFTGTGALLPQFQMTIPGAAVGARVTASGALMVHAGEHVRPATIARDWRGDGGGDTINLNVTTPTQVLDPTDVNRQLAFYRKLGGR